MAINLFKNFNFGPVEDVFISHLGIAIENDAGEMVSYDTSTDSIVNVDMLSCEDIKGMIFEMPCAIKDISKGDVIRHVNGNPVFVKEIKDNHIYVIDVAAGEAKEILPPTSIFGFNFVTKIVSLFDILKTEASADNPFGNLLPFMLLNKKENSSSSLNKIMLFSMMTSKKEGNNTSIDLNNPLFLMTLMNDKGGSESNDFFQMIMLMQMMKNQTKKQEN